MATIVESLRERMPLDLLQYLENQESLSNILVCEQKPADVAFEVIPAGPTQMKAYFPPFSSHQTVVVIHFPGGIRKRGIDRDRSWCSNLAQDSGCIYIAIDYPSAPDYSFRQILSQCESVLDQVRQLCQGRWKEKWSTNPTRIVLSGSSIGATLAIIIAVIATRNDLPVYGLIALVPVIDTEPNLAGSPWGENENTVGLTPDRLLEDLDAAFGGEDSSFRMHFYSNPRKMPDYAIRLLPPMAMVLAKLDILYQSQLEFRTRLLAQSVNLSCIKVDGIHQVKDLDCVTVAGREARQYILEVSRNFMERAACFAKEDPT